MSFASEQLHLNIPYFYLHKAGDDLSDLGPNVIPVCYGMEYSDLSNAVEDMANYRIRTRYRDSGIIRVNPYVKTRKSFTASYRLHYLNEFCKFVGREKELVELNKFCSADKELLWWSLVGKGGIGKSRLVYQWLKQLSNNWFGFFAKTDVDVERYREFKPFSDTVIVIDYVLGNEDKCATIVTTLFERFEYSRFKLRLLFVDRRYQNNENNWYDRIVGKMDMQTRLWFQECSYNNKTTLSPLVISELSEEEELEFINVYLEAYLNNVADDDTKVKYSSVLPDTADQIYSNFKTALKEECDRPLFVAVYTELWIYKDGCISVTSLDEMLAAFLKREEDRWLLCLDNHSNLLKDYAFFIGVHNAELTQQTANLMDKYNQIADKIAENGYIATWCTENYARLMLLWLRRNDYRSAANCWKQMMKFQQRFADDEDILKAIAGAADALYDIYRENQVPGRRCKLLKDMERIFDETHNADVANALAILEANEHTIYDPPAVFDSNKSEILLSTENKLKEIYEAFPNEGKVVLGYSYLVSWNYVTWLDFPRPIDEELIPLFKKWIRKFPENKLELMEYYSFILFEKWLYMDSLDNISEANKIYYEIKAIADELSKDYADNQVTQMLSMGIVRKL